jgi:hypothetical protein
MSIQEIFPEQFAELFHHFHQVLGPDFGGAAAPELEDWDRVPQQEKSRLVAAARLALLELEAESRHHEDTRKYFARPGEAEWGC